MPEPFRQSPTRSQSGPMQARRNTGCFPLAPREELHLHRTLSPFLPVRLPSRAQSWPPGRGLQTTCRKRRSGCRDEGDDPLLVRTLIGITVVRLRIRSHPLGNLVGIDVDRTVVDPCGESFEALCAVVLGHTGPVPVVPIVETTDEVVTFDTTVGQQRSTVQASSVEDGDVGTGLPPNDHEVDRADNDTLGFNGSSSSKTATDSGCMIPPCRQPTT